MEILLLISSLIVFFGLGVFLYWVSLNLLFSTLSENMILSQRVFLVIGSLMFSSLSIVVLLGAVLPLLKEILGVK